jgi:anti-anti-sigma factor
LKLTTNEDILTIFLIGDIDAQNASEVQKEIQKIMESHDEKTLVFDAKEISYISSAGLKVILTVQKQLKEKISVINISPDVVEIFKMAGFQHIMKIQGCK